MSQRQPAVDSGRGRSTAGVAGGGVRWMTQWSGTQLVSASDAGRPLTGVEGAGVRKMTQRSGGQLVLASDAGRRLTGVEGAGVRQMGQRPGLQEGWGACGHQDSAFACSGWGRHHCWCC